MKQPIVLQQIGPPIDGEHTMARANLLELGPDQAHEALRSHTLADQPFTLAELLGSSIHLPVSVCDDLVSLLGCASAARGALEPIGFSFASLARLAGFHRRTVHRGPSVVCQAGGERIRFLHIPDGSLI
jgi:hypothetical protein